MARPARQSKAWPDKVRPCPDRPGKARPGKAVAGQERWQGKAMQAHAGIGNVRRGQAWPDKAR